MTALPDESTAEAGATGLGQTAVPTEGAAVLPSVAAQDPATSAVATKLSGSDQLPNTALHVPPSPPSRPLPAEALSHASCVPAANSVLASKSTLHSKGPCGEEKKADAPLSIVSQAESWGSAGQHDVHGSTLRGSDVDLDRLSLSSFLSLAEPAAANPTTAANPETVAQLETVTKPETAANPDTVANPETVVDPAGGRFSIEGPQRRHRDDPSPSAPLGPHAAHPPLDPPAKGTRGTAGRDAAGHCGLNRAQGPEGTTACDGPLQGPGAPSSQSDHETKLRRRRAEEGGAGEGGEGGESGEAFARCHGNTRKSSLAGPSTGTLGTCPGPQGSRSGRPRAPSTKLGGGAGTSTPMAHPRLATALTSGKATAGESSASGTGVRTTGSSTSGTGGSTRSQPALGRCSKNTRAATRKELAEMADALMESNPVYSPNEASDAMQGLRVLPDSQCLRGAPNASPLDSQCSEFPGVVPLDSKCSEFPDVDPSGSRNPSAEQKRGDPASANDRPTGVLSRARARNARSGGLSGSGTGEEGPHGDPLGRPGEPRAHVGSDGAPTDLQGLPQVGTGTAIGSSRDGNPHGYPSCMLRYAAVPKVNRWAGDKGHSGDQPQAQITGSAVDDEVMLLPPTGSCAQPGDKEMVSRVAGDKATRKEAASPSVSSL